MKKTFNDEIIYSPLAYILSLLLCTVWLILIFIGPLLYKLPQSFYSFSDMYYYLFHFTCHQQPSRCYWLLDYQLPVCVRCFGIYFGAFIGLLVYPFFKSIKSTSIPKKAWLLLCFLPIGIDGICSTIHIYSSPHWLRLITGILCGGVAMYYIIPGLNDVVRIVKDN
ncbi:MAG: DUF2085 domain-containing protein [Cyanobacteriota bacterium]